MRIDITCDIAKRIDIAREQLLTLSEAAKLLPRRRGGKKTHSATLYRWASRGLRGCRLKVLQVGGCLCTSVEALQRFFSALTAAHTDGVSAS